MYFSSINQLHYLLLPTDLFCSIIILRVLLILSSTSLSSPPYWYFLKHHYPPCTSRPLLNFIIFLSLLIFSDASLSSVYFLSFAQLHYLPLPTDLFWCIIILRVFLILCSTSLSSPPKLIFSEASLSSVYYSSFAQLHYLPLPTDLFWCIISLRVFLILCSTSLSSPPYWSFLKHHHPLCISYPLLNFIIFLSLLIFSDASLDSVYFSSFAQLHCLPLPTDLFWCIIILRVFLILCSTSLSSPPKLIFSEASLSSVYFSSFAQLHCLPLPSDLFWSIIIVRVFLILCSTSLSSPPSWSFLTHHYPLCNPHPLLNFIIFPSLLIFSEASLSSVYFSTFAQLHYLSLPTDLFWCIISLRVFFILLSTSFSSPPYWSFLKHHYPPCIFHPFLNFIIFPSLLIFFEP